MSQAETSCLCLIVQIEVRLQFVVYTHTQYNNGFYKYCVTSSINNDLHHFKAVFFFFFFFLIHGKNLCLCLVLSQIAFRAELGVYGF